MANAQVTVRFTVNGRESDFDVRSNVTLLELLREQVRLTGSKVCCQLGECGACTVMIDGRAVNSCLMLAVEAEGSSITTIEGLAAGGRLNSLQEAFLDKGAVQCGFCIPGQVMAAWFLLQRNPRPTLDEVREGLSGNLCRCGGYQQICDAVLAASETVR